MEQVKATTGYQWAKRTTTNRLYAELASKPKRNKYGAKKVKLDGYTFDSKREAEVYHGLKYRQLAGDIVRLDVQPKFDLVVNGVKIATYTADFAYTEQIKRAAHENIYLGHIVDVKSPPTAKKRDFVLIKKLMKACHGIEVEVVT